MMFDNKKFIANRIKYHREKKNLTQRELAEMVGIGEQQVSRLENGRYKPSLNTFFLIVDVLEIDLREFGFRRNKSCENPIINQLINKLFKASEPELIFYKNLFDSIDKSFIELHDDYHIFKN